MRQELPEKRPSVEVIGRGPHEGAQLGVRDRSGEVEHVTRERFDTLTAVVLVLLVVRDRLE